jgi:hypothetical protein
VINAIKFSIEEIEASDQYFDHTGDIAAELRDELLNGKIFYILK